MNNTTTHTSQTDLAINTIVSVQYIGEDNPIALRTNKIYDARVLKKGWFGIVDESGEEYAYPPRLFQIIKQ